MINTGLDHLWKETAVLLAVWSTMFWGDLSDGLRDFISYWCLWELRIFGTCHEVLSTVSHPKWVWSYATHRSKPFITKPECILIDRWGQINSFNICFELKVKLWPLLYRLFLFFKPGYIKYAVKIYIKYFVLKYFFYSEEVF